MRHLTSFASTRWGKLLLAVVLIALVAGLVFQGVGREPASAAPAQVSEMSSFLCTPIAVAAFSNRVHVQCTTAPAADPAVYWFAYPTSDSAGASRILSVFSTAYALGHRVWVWYTVGDTSGSAWGCGSSDCRAIWGASVTP